ncbi:NAD(P)-binding protein [Lentinus tigrinus ALCF2SS1-7]|uniref:NAD(P)-binding protein n=1 Tax=Lentinus tigrinus ALCF2SS1-6 TaxID=1328759 RepID=A0A5C2SP71_9APHY|nr:NAD(P)-binding protein [Lentinus tigrinus ALCF2SS1-6]RPD81981.1 NAD(P)-binding protein [Lentinus tigrinus ALCF2SS1-7]
MTGIKDAKCVLVVGATAGIGRALALAIHDLDNNPTVIVAGRRQDRLDELAKRRERIQTARVDINTTHDKLKQFVGGVLSEHPNLDAVILSSGIQHIFDFKKPETIDFNKIDDEFNTNYVAVLKLIVLFLPHFLKLSAEGRPSFIIPITSGLAIQPKADVPNYCATKAALHSLDLSLRAQLADTQVRVIEILPPLVESELHDHQGMTPRLSKVWMPLDEFTKQVMEGLVRGDPQVTAGFASKVLEKYEKDKRESVEEAFKNK